MARNNRSSSRPSSSFNKPTQRPHSTTASAPTTTAQQAQAPIQAQSTASGGGIMSNILQTAAGVAIGHTVGRMVSGIFEGSSNNSIDSNSISQQQQANNSPVQCQADTKRFLDCMQQNYDDVSACQNYLEMLKTCQRQFAQ